MFNATFNDISFFFIVAARCIYDENRNMNRKPLTCSKSLTNCVTVCSIKYISSSTGFELTTFVMITTHCIGSCKSSYHKITTTPRQLLNKISEWLLLNTNSAKYRLYHGENKLYFNEVMMFTCTRPTHLVGFL
jgi:hypothetical protein